MKKFLKRTLVLLLAATLLCGMCGCKALEEMRQNQAFLQDDGTILWNGNIYKKLNYSEILYPEIDYGRDIYVTLPDVPVLLSAIEAAIAVQPSKDGKFLEYLDSNDFYNYYCRADIFDEISQRISSPFEPEIYCYFYYVFDEEAWEYNELHYQLTAEEVEAVKLVTRTVEPYSANNLGRPEAVYSVYLYGCSGDMLLQSCTTEIIATTGGYSLLVYTGTDELVFPVPKGMHATFRQMLDAYVRAEQFTDIESDI